MTSATTIVVAHAAIGSGHRIAAEALAAEFATDERLGVDVIDALEYGRSSVRGNSLTWAFSGPTAGIYDAVWSSAALGGTARAIGRPFLAAMFRRFEQTLLERSPAAVVCTHALPAVLAARLVHIGKADFRVVNVATDFGVHGFWPRTGVSLFCVADDASADALYERGFDRSAVAVTGIPVRTQFTLEYDCDAARRHYGLPSERRVVLALAGSMMSGPYERFKEALAVSLPALASLPGSAVAIVCGNDEEFAEQLRVRAAGFGTTNVQVFGFVEQIAPLMACADLGITKPGGAICAEALATGMPLVLLGPAAGQERANAKRLAETGAATFSSDPRLLAEYARKAVSRPARLTKMREAAASLARPFAATDVKERLVRLLDLDQERSVPGL